MGLMSRDLVARHWPFEHGRGAAGAAAGLRFGDLSAAAARVPRLGGTAVARGCGRGRRSRAARVVLYASEAVKTPPEAQRVRGQRKLFMRRPMVRKTCGRGASNPIPC